MAALVWDNASQAWKEAETPMAYDLASNVFAETTGLVWDAESEAWAEVWSPAAKMVVSRNAFNYILGINDGGSTNTVLFGSDYAVIDLYKSSSSYSSAQVVLISKTPIKLKNRKIKVRCKIENYSLQGNGKPNIDVLACSKTIPNDRSVSRDTVSNGSMIYNFTDFKSSISREYINSNSKEFILSGELTGIQGEYYIALSVEWSNDGNNSGSIKTTLYDISIE